MQPVISICPIKAERKSGPFDLVGLVDGLAGRKLRDGDVLVISSKFVAISEGRIVTLGTVSPGEHAKALSAKYNVSPEMCELIIRESDEILGGVHGFILASKDSVLTPNAGIDKSNIDAGKVVLYPRDPLASALTVAEAMQFRHGIRIGVVIADSRLMPTRKGTTGVALAAAGLEAVLDLRGKEDLFGNALRVTSQAIADDLCSAAQLVMGESDEATPLVLVRGVDSKLMVETEYPSRRFAVRTDQCVFMRSLGYKTRRTCPRVS